MIILENDDLIVNLHPKGAEIHKIIGKHDNVNYMWKRDACQWANSAPILFPIVGALNGGKCLIDGEEYSMGQHGFARHSEFDTNQISKEKVVFTLLPNTTIKEQYPYEFKLEVTYELIKNNLKCSIKVTNEDNRIIHFQVGGHPAFACPLTDEESSNDYYIEFSQNETLERKVIDLEKKGMSHIVEPFFDNEKRFFIRQYLFDRDAIVFKDFKSKSISLKSINHNKSLVFHMNGFDHVGIWAAKHVGGLIAIEPWVGHADYYDFKGEFKDKESCVALDVDKSFECFFKIEINQ